jgi:hypothetical protein
MAAFEKLQVVQSSRGNFYLCAASATWELNAFFPFLASCVYSVSSARWEIIQSGQQTFLSTPAAKSFFTNEVENSLSLRENCAVTNRLKQL